jgi:hypothetical protein
MTTNIALLHETPNWPFIGTEETKRSENAPARRTVIVERTALAFAHYLITGRSLVGARPSAAELNIILSEYNIMITPAELTPDMVRELARRERRRRWARRARRAEREDRRATRRRRAAEEENQDTGLHTGLEPSTEL